MRAKILVASFVMLFGARAATAQKAKHPSELLPDSTIAYFEVKQIGALAKEVGALLKKTALSNPPFSFQKYMKKFNLNRVRIDDELATFALAVSPEVLRELGRLGTVAGGITGMVDNEMPEFAVIADAGKSNVPKFAIRAFLSMERFALAGRVDGVPLWGERAEPRANDPVLAFLPKTKLIVFGTQRAVKDIVRRHKGKAEGKSLSDTAAYKAAVKEASNEPGLFACANIERVVDLFVELGKVNRELAIFQQISKLINPKAFRAAAYEATLKDGALRYREIAILDPKEKSPLLDLLPSKAVDLNLAKYAAKDSWIFAALSNSDGALRFARIMQLADAIAGQVAPNQPLPSAHVQQVEQQLGIDLGKDVIGKIDGVSVSMSNPFAVEKAKNNQGANAMWVAMLNAVVQATDVKAAKHLTETVVPKLLQAASRGQPVQVKTQKIGGHNISVANIGPDNSLAFSWALDGKNILLGLNPRNIADALTRAKKGGGLLSDAKLAARMKKIDQPFMIGSMKYFSFLMGMFMAIEKVRVQPPLPKIEDKKRGLNNREQPVAVQQKQPEFLKIFQKIAAKEQPLVFAVSRSKDQIVEQAEMVGLREFVPALINFGIEGYFQGRRDFKQAVPVPPRQPPDKKVIEK